MKKWTNLFKILPLALLTTKIETLSAAMEGCPYLSSDDMHTILVNPKHFKRPPQQVFYKEPHGPLWTVDAQWWPSTPKTLFSVKDVNLVNQRCSGGFQWCGYAYTIPQGDISLIYTLKLHHSTKECP